MTLLPTTHEANAARVAEVVRPLASKSRGRPVFLVDADRTIVIDLVRKALEPFQPERAEPTKPAPNQPMPSKEQPQP